MKATVIIPVYNGAAYVSGAIESALGQTERDIEVIVVDDGSTDGTPEVLRRYTDSRLHVIRQRNAGPSAARNRGIAASRGEWVGFLDADDTWRPGKIAAHLKRAAEVPEAALTYSSVLVRDHKGAPIRTLYADREGWVLESLLFGNFIRGGGSSTMVRRDALEQVGPFDPEIKYGEDWELWLRIAAAYPFAAIAEPLTCRVERPDSYGTHTAAMRDDCLAFLTSAFDSYASAYQRLRPKAIAEVYYRAAIDLHDERECRSACVDLVRTLRRNPFHRYAYRRLLRLAVSLPTLRPAGSAV